MVALRWSEGYAGASQEKHHRNLEKAILFPAINILYIAILTTGRTYSRKRRRRSAKIGGNSCESNHGLGLKWFQRQFVSAVTLYFNTVFDIRCQRPHMGTLKGLKHDPYVL